MVQGDNDWSRNLLQEFKDLHSGNILTVRFSHDSDSKLMATGSSDKSVAIFNYETGEVVFKSLHHGGGVISLDFHPTKHNLLLSGSMASTHSVIDIFGQKVLQQFKDHQKYVTRVRWTPNGLGFVTSSYDFTVGIYGLANENEARFELKKTIVFANIVEAIELWDDTILNQQEIIVSVREDNYLNYIHLLSYQIRRVNMNANLDDHISFTALDLSLSPNSSHLLVATDKSRIIMFRTGTSIQLRQFYGGFNDGFSNPRLCWDQSSKYIYCTSQDYKIYVWDVVTQKIVHMINAHSAIPRDLDFKKSRKILASCGFDRTVKLWIS